MSNSKILLADEPTIGLAPKICDRSPEAAEQGNGTAVPIAEQNANFALSLAAEIHVLETGSLRMSGKPEELRSDRELAKA